MENYDSLIQEQNTKQDVPFDKEAWAEGKQQERRQLFEMIDKMADKTLSDTGMLTDYLSMQSNLNKTSVGNTLQSFRKSRMPRISPTMRTGRKEGARSGKARRGCWYWKPTGNMPEMTEVWA